MGSPSAPEGSDPVNKLPLTFFNDLEVSPDGSEVFITDTRYGFGTSIL
jgi:sugar lactone lactonase YvrE